jgi:hypothetical protein
MYFVVNLIGFMAAEWLGIALAAMAFHCRVQGFETWTIWAALAYAAVMAAEKSWRRRNKVAG